jgi:hypothetical protein
MMQRHWSQPAYDDPSNESTCPVCSRLAHDPFPLPEVPPEDAPPTPLVNLRGHWLEQMGFGVGATVRIEAVGSRIILDVVANPSEIQHGVPTLLEREVHYTEVEADIPHRVHPWSDL